MTLAGGMAKMFTQQACQTPHVTGHPEGGFSIERGHCAIVKTLRDSLELSYRQGQYSAQSVSLECAHEYIHHLSW